jgi:NleD-like pathogen effector protein (putative zinc metallopeptidase)
MFGMVPPPVLQAMQARHDLDQGLAGPDTHDAATARGGSALEQGQTSLFGRVGQTLGDLGRGLSQEGVGGLLDPAGMMDRQAAQRELSSRFQVVPDDFVGPRRANQVTEAEYEKVAHTFSDIRMGRGDLSVNTSMIKDPAQAEQYKQGTMVAIADMMMTEGGRNQIENFHNNVMKDDAGNARHGIGDPMKLPFGLEAALPEVHRHTEIRPFFKDANNDGNLTNDPTTAADYDNTNAMADARGASGDTPSGTIDASGRGKWGRVGGAGGERGPGTDSTIWWNPTANVGNCNRSDVILAHEMQHAFHETQGTMAAGTYAGPGPDAAAGIANFERQAVGLPTTGSNPNDSPGLSENQYRQERNDLGLGDKFLQRQNYSGTLPGQAP